jgi:hypothetical protein
MFGRRRRAQPGDNVIDVHIARLRRKIDEGFDRFSPYRTGVGFTREDRSERHPPQPHSHTANAGFVSALAVVLLLYSSAACFFLSGLTSSTSRHAVQI